MVGQASMVYPPGMTAMYVGVSIFAGSGSTARYRIK